MQEQADLFCRVARCHGECKSAKVQSVEQNAAVIELELNVEMPFRFKVDGGSPNGVRTTEIVRAFIGPNFPWTLPQFGLRMDFPRNLPHLQPGAANEYPVPCLVDGSPREFFYQFGLAEVGIFYLIEQLTVWLRKAAQGALIDLTQGWEPTQRRDLRDLVFLDVEGYQAAVNKRSDWRVFDANFARYGQEEHSLLHEDVFAIVHATTTNIPLRKSNEDKQFSGRRLHADAIVGGSVSVLIWAGKDSGGRPIIAEDYAPETVTTLGELRGRADELGCLAGLTTFISVLERYFDGYLLNAPRPITLVLAVRRPCHLIGSNSDIELLPYIVEINANSERTSLFSDGDNTPVRPAQAFHTVNPELLRTVSGTDTSSTVAVIGCGSVGSKMALHLAKSGVSINVLADNGFLSSHHMARHGLVRNAFAGKKADELADEIAKLGQSPKTYTDDLVPNLLDRKKRALILPKSADFALNTTASLAVREALSNLPASDLKLRLAEAALFGRGRGAYMLIEGPEHNPTLTDLIGELYARPSNAREKNLLFDPEFGLTEVQIGPGCASLTMPMTDSRLSSMTGGLTEEFQRILKKPPSAGEIIVGIADSESPSTNWDRIAIAPFSSIAVNGAPGWTIRLSQSVIERMRTDQQEYPGVETGGVMIGLCSARLKSITVIDLLPAPLDSKRTKAEFVLGTSGLKAAIEMRFIESGQSLSDVGTWHTHLIDCGPSPTDRSTARALAVDRTPPSCLFILTPNDMYAHMEPPNG